MVRVIEYHFVSLHELFKCTIGNNVGSLDLKQMYPIFFEF
jgi:hypothetical protein